MADKKNIYVSLEPEVFKALVDLANTVGARLGEYAALMIFRGIREVSKERPTDPAALLNRRFLEMRYRQDQLSMLRSLYVSATEDQNERDLDAVEDLANQLGFTLDQIKDYVGSVPSIMSSSDTAVDIAAAWLQNQIEPGGSVSMRALEKLAQESGIKPWALKQAKKSIGIISQRLSAEWVWKRVE